MLFFSRGGGAQAVLRAGWDGQPTIAAVRRTPLAACCALLAALSCTASPARAEPVLVLDGHGRATLRDDPFLPPAADPVPSARGAARRARAAAKRHPTVRETLAALLGSGALDQTAHDRYLASYDAAQRTLRRLHGRRFTELKAVLATLDDLSVRRRLDPGRLPLLFRTLDVNRRWWTTGPLLGYGRRVELSGSDIVWQAYPGQGLQIQWLGTFGRANGLFTGKEPKYDARLGRLLDEARALATPRAGGIAWEYAFRFDGGRPPWVSALAQGTALSAYARAAVRLGRPELFQVARDALGIFRTPPPEGVAVATPAGTHYLIYSFWPALRVLNGFVQSLNGLHDFAALANDPEGRTLFAAGEAELRTEIPRYDTGAWSMYSNLRESDLGYHLLLRDFLRGLCERLRDDGGTPDPALYCTTAERFTAYVRQAPRLVLQRAPRPRVRRRAAVRFTLSKVSVVTLTVTRRGAVVFRRSVRLGRGRHTIAWGPPRAPGPVGVTLVARDLAGNVGRARGALRVAR